MIARFRDHGVVGIRFEGREPPATYGPEGLQSPPAGLLPLAAAADEFLERRPLVPGVDAVEAFVAERDAAMVRMVPLCGGLRRKILHRMGPRHRRARRAVDGPGPVVAERPRAAAGIAFPGWFL